MELYFGAHKTFVSSLDHCSYHNHVSIHLHSETHRDQVRRACVHSLNWRALSTETFDLVPTHGRQPSALCRMMKPSFWKLGAYHNSFFVQFTCKLRQVFASQSLSCCNQLFRYPFLHLPGTIGLNDSGESVEISLYAEHSLAPLCLRSQAYSP